VIRISPQNYDVRNWNDGRKSSKSFEGRCWCDRQTDGLTDTTLLGHSESNRGTQEKIKASEPQDTSNNGGME